MNKPKIRRPNISILGSYQATHEETSLAYDLGSQLANMSLNVISGGQKGVMHSLCKGLHENRIAISNESCTIVGILPSQDFLPGNEYLDIAIPTGFGAIQNSILPLCADVVIAIGGAGGTLTELSFAWQYKKPIALIGSTGWSSKLAGQRLDERRIETLPHFMSVVEVVDWVKQTLKHHALM